MPELPEPASLRISLFVERAVPVKSLLAAWSQKREDLARLIQTSGCKVCFGETLEAHEDPYALDNYELAKSRKHRVDLVCELPRIDVAGQITKPVLAFAKIYHTIQGIVRGNATRLAALRC